MSALGRREPSDWIHVTRHPLTAAAPTAAVEVVFPVPSQWRGRYDQGSKNACFPPGTRVRMADGSQRPIEEVRLLDEVVTAEGRTGRVLQTMVRLHEGEAVDLKVWGHHGLRMTPEHPVLTRRGYVPAKDIQDDDWIALPRYAPGRLTTLRTEELVPKKEQARIRTTGTRRQNSVTGGMIETPLSPLPEEIPLTQEFGQIVGLFLAEGWTSQSLSAFCFGGHERKTLVPLLDGLIREVLGAEPYIQVRGNGTINVSLYGKHWRMFFEALGSAGAGNKRLHPLLCAGTPEFLRGVLNGWLAGDGHRHAKRGHTTGVTISHDLALNMFDIAQALGMQPAIAVGEPSANQWAKTRQLRWSVELRPEVRDHWRAAQDDAHVWRKVHSVSRSPFTGFVFNLHVQGDESYVAEGIGVHNCVGFSSSWMLSLLNRHLYDPLWLWNRAKAVDEFPDTNPGDNEGTSVRAAMDVLRLQGAVRVLNGKDRPVSAEEGISANQWATRPDDVRTAIGTLRVPCVLGINWYANFDSPVVWKGERWIGRASDLGPVRGGHALCVHGWSDKRQAARLVNSWGVGWPDVWLPAAVLGRLLSEGGEATMVTDRLHPAGEG